jgi:TolA-binding protein
MKSLIASSLVALSLIAGIASTASAEPQFGSRAWWEAQTNG